MRAVVAAGLALLVFVPAFALAFLVHLGGASFGDAARLGGDLWLAFLVAAQMAYWLPRPAPPGRLILCAAAGCVAAALWLLDGRAWWPAVLLSAGVTGFALLGVERRWPG